MLRVRDSAKLSPVDGAAVALQGVPGYSIAGSPAHKAKTEQHGLALVCGLMDAMAQAIHGGDTNRQFTVRRADYKPAAIGQYEDYQAVIVGFWINNAWKFYLQRYRIDFQNAGRKPLAGNVVNAVTGFGIDAAVGSNLAQDAGRTQRLGAGGLAAFGATYAVAQGKYNTLKTECGGRCTDPKYADTVDSGKRMELVSNVSVGVGAVALAAGTAMIIFGGPKWKPRPATGAWTLPSVAFSPHGAGLRYEAAF